MTKIAVITPCYNTEEYIYDCLWSVSKTITFGEFEFEHVVVDDGSTDKSWEIIDKFDSPNLKKIRCKQNKGQCFARNFAVSKTDAEYILFLDADDVIFQNSLRTLVSFLPANWLYFDFLASNEKLNYLIGNDYYGVSFTDNKKILRSMYADEHFFQGNCLLRKEVFVQVRGYDEKVSRAADFDLYTRILIKGYFPKYIPAPLYIHRFHDKNMSNVHRANPNLHREDIKKFYLKYEKDLNNLLRS